jgi:hypothetical protein
MSNVKGSTVISFVRQGDTINTALRSTKPLEQFLRRGTATVVPDWTVATNRPTIYPVVRSALSNSRQSPLINTEVWKYNGTTITFTGDTSNAMGSLAAGTFQKGRSAVDGDVQVPTLTICKNLASADNINADVIEFSAVVNTGFDAAIAASIDIRVEEIEGDSFVSYIAVNDGGVIDDNTSSLTLTAILNKGGTEQTSGVTYAWYKAAGSTWTSVNKTTKSITLTKTDIDTQELYRVDFTVSGSVVTTSSISVYDESDPLVVVPNPDRAEEVSTGSPAINYTPIVCKQGDTAMTPVTGYSFTYLLTNSAYDSIATGSGATFAVTYAHGVAAGGNMTLIITATN